MKELLRIAAEIEGTSARRSVSPHLLSGLVECSCGTKMYGRHNYISTKRGRYQVGYYRCRRASHQVTCTAKQIPAPVVERIVIDELRRLGLGPGRVAALAGEAQQTYDAAMHVLSARRVEVCAELERITDRLGSLLELAEDRLVTKQECGARRAQLETEKASLENELAGLESAIAAQVETGIDAAGTTLSVRRLGDVFDELDDVVDQRHLLATCLSRVVVRQDALELHVAAVPLLGALAQEAEGPQNFPVLFT
jgi:hypothetical protein